MLQTRGARNNLQVPNPTCSQQLCSSHWNTATNTASTTIRLQATRDGVPDGNHHLQMDFNPIVPVGGGMYLDCFSNYTIPPVQVTAQDTRPFSCTWSTDPHFHGFNRQSFHLYDTGDYTVYKSPQENFEVQARTIACAGQTACQCGVAIREENDIIRISNCGLGTLTPKIEVNHQPLRPGTLIRRSCDGRHILVKMPSGRTLKVDVQRGWHTTTLTLPGSDRGKGGMGACGNLNGHASTQFTHSTGKVDTNACDRQGQFSFKSSSQCIPVAFLDSWKNNQHTSLFYNNPLTSHPPNSGTPPSHPCLCDTSSTPSPSSCTAPTTNPPQQCSGTCKNVTSQVPPWVNAHWQNGRRDVSVSEDIDKADPPVNLTRTSSSGWHKTWPTASGLSENQAAEGCLRALRASQLYSACRDQTSLLDFSLQSCVLDVLFSDSFDMAEANVAGYTANCQLAMMQDISNYVTDHDGNLVLQSHVTEICSVTCFAHGHCVRGKCVCDAGYAGDNCQLLAGKGPELSRIRSSNACDVNQRPCRKVFIDADNFQDSERFFCRVQEYLPDGRLSSKTFEERAEFITDGRLACPLPDLHVNTGRAAVTVAVSVTDDGYHYSNRLPLTVYDSTCVTCGDGVCRPKDNFCLIDNVCYRDGDVKTDDVTKTCRSSVTSSQWSSSQHVTSYPTPLTQPQGHPDLTSPSLRDIGDMLICTVQSNTHVASARFEVTWLVDEVEVSGMKAVLSANQRHAYITLQDLPQGGSVMCQVRAFYDGGRSDDVSDTFLSNSLSLSASSSLDG